MKPDNIILDGQGHAILTDFGLAKECPGDARTTTFCGTPAYLAPEVVKGRRYGKSVDWWGVGVVSYELLYGVPPFESSDLSQLCDQIIKGLVDYNKRDKHDTDPVTKDFLSGLLKGDVSTRLGASGDGAEVKAHPWFEYVSWSSLLHKKGVAPYNPTTAVPRFEPQDLKGILEEMSVDPEGDDGPSAVGNQSGGGGGEGNEMGFSGLLSGAMGAMEDMLDDLTESGGPDGGSVSHVLSKGNTDAERLVWGLLQGIEGWATTSALPTGRLTRQVVAERLIELIPVAKDGKTAGELSGPRLRVLQGGLKVLGRSLWRWRQEVCKGCLRRWQVQRLAGAAQHRP